MFRRYPVGYRTSLCTRSQRYSVAFILRSRQENPYGDVAGALLSITRPEAWSSVHLQLKGLTYTIRQHKIQGLAIFEASRAPWAGLWPYTTLPRSFQTHRDNTAFYTLPGLDPECVFQSDECLSHEYTSYR